MLKRTASQGARVASSHKWTHVYRDWRQAVHASTLSGESGSRFSAQLGIFSWSKSANAAFFSLCVSVGEMTGD